jgi:hypothetical protein
MQYLTDIAWTRRTGAGIGADRNCLPRRIAANRATWWNIAKRFLNCLEGLAGAKEPFAGQLAEFATYQRDERGLSVNTIKAQCRQLKDFFKSLTTHKISLAQITIHEIDGYFSLKASESSCRLTIRTKAGTLRVFFRFAERRRRSASGIMPLGTFSYIKTEAMPPTIETSSNLRAATRCDANVDSKGKEKMQFFLNFKLRTAFFYQMIVR